MLTDDNCYMIGYNVKIKQNVYFKYNYYVILLVYNAYSINAKKCGGVVLKTGTWKPQITNYNLSFRPEQSAVH